MPFFFIYTRHGLFHFQTINMKRLSAFIITVLCGITLHAQTFLDTLRKDVPGQGTVTVVQSPEIDKLVNGTEKPVAKPNDGNGNSGQQHSQQTDNKKHEQQETTAPGTSTHDDNSSTSQTEETVVDTRKKIMRNSYKTQGYRIQVFSGGNSRANRQKAETAGAVMKSNFPSEPIYVHFYSPSWKCRMGNYKTVEEARALLAQVKKLGYPQACIVKGTISVQY